MKRPRTTSFVAPEPQKAAVVVPELPAAPNWRELAPVVATLLATLDTMEVGPKAGPAVKVHRSALRRQGEAAAAMEAVLQEVSDTDPRRAESRTRLIREAWVGLPRWRT